MTGVTDVHIQLTSDLCWSMHLVCGPHTL